MRFTLRNIPFKMYGTRIERRVIHVAQSPHVNWQLRLAKSAKASESHLSLDLKIAHMSVRAGASAHATVVTEVVVVTEAQ